MPSLKSKKSPAPKSPITVGNAVFIRTVTHHYTGKIVAVSKEEILLTNAAWIAENGRFAQALSSGQFAEIEPYPEGPVSIARGAVLDVSLWKHALPRSVR